MAHYTSSAESPDKVERQASEYLARRCLVPDRSAPTGNMTVRTRHTETYTEADHHSWIKFVPSDTRKDDIDDLMLFRVLLFRTCTYVDAGFSVSEKKLLLEISGNSII